MIIEAAIARMVIRRCLETPIHRPLARARSDRYRPIPARIFSVSSVPLCWV